MDTISTQTWIIVACVVVLALIALAAWFIYKKKQSHRLQERFGPEYGRSVDDLGSRTKAESELKAREKRVERLTLVPLAPSEAARFSQTWKDLQGRFVDNRHSIGSMYTAWRKCCIWTKTKGSAPLTFECLSQRLPLPVIHNLKQRAICSLCRCYNVTLLHKCSCSGLSQRAASIKGENPPFFCLRSRGS